MNYNLSQKRLFILFLVCWFVINFLQAVFTEIYPDEAYYSLYGKYLSWGYFDHPPLVALIARTSSLIFTGNLGVRFITVVLQIATLVLVWLQLKENHQSTKKVVYFFIIAASLVMFSVYGFLTAPDAPLLFFTALFLYGYKQYINKPTGLFAIILATAMAGLVYSKYQGVLVIVLVVISNLRLLTQPKFYLAGFVAFLLITPHLWWQYSNDFPSLKYQLIDRSDGFKWRFFFEYLPNQMAVFNPFTLGAIFYVLYKTKPVDLFERALYFIIIGFILFFWVMVIRGKVEPHWTTAASIPILILLTNKTLVDQQVFHYIRRFVAPSLVLVFATRILIITTLLPTRLDISGKIPRYISIEKIAGNKPVIFTGSFQDPSLYTFSTGKQATVISSLESRKTEFDIWQFEQKWMNQPVFVCGQFEGKSVRYKNGAIEINGFFADSLQTANRLQISFNIYQHTIRPGDTIILKFTILNPTDQNINFHHPVFPIEICPIFIKGKNIHKTPGMLLQKITMLNANEQIETAIKFSIPDLPKGAYHLGLSCTTLFGPAFNSNFEKVTLN